jgi:DNA replication protein DnaC
MPNAGSNASKSNEPATAGGHELEARSFARLLLDEPGYVPCFKPGAELLFDVVSRAYERTSRIVTTNLPFEQWTEVLGSERLTGALLDRLPHRVHILEATARATG